MPRGGKRQGTQGRAYSNRTDLAVNYGPQGNAAAGGMEAPREQTPLIAPAIGVDEVPNLGDPTARLDEPVTAGLPLGPGAGPEALGPMPPPQVDPVRQAVQAMMMVAPNPDLIRVLARLDYEGR